MISSRQIEAFRAIILSGGITAAGNLMHVTQPAISRLIKDLEYELGFALFERRKNRIYPTSMGMTLYAEVERSFIGLDRIVSIAKQIRDFETGRLRIACMPVMAMALMPKVVTVFSEKYPKVSIDLDVFNSPTVLQRTSGGQCDIGFVNAEQDSNGVSVGLKLRSSSACVMPEGHPLARLETITPKDLEDIAFVSMNTDLMQRYRIDDVFKEANIQRKMQIQATLTSTVIELVRQGAGVSIVECFVAAESGLDVRNFEPCISYDYSLIQPVDQPNAGLVKQFMEIFHKELPSDLNII